MEPMASPKRPKVDLFLTTPAIGEPSSSSLTPLQGYCPYLCRIPLSKKHYEDPLEKDHSAPYRCLFLPLRSPVMDASVGWVTRPAYATMNSAFGPGYDPICGAALAAHHAPARVPREACFWHHSVSSNVIMAGCMGSTQEQQDSGVIWPLLAPPLRGNMSRNWTKQSIGMLHICSCRF